jgi:hypothetical protein
MSFLGYGQLGYCSMMERCVGRPFSHLRDVIDGLGDIIDRVGGRQLALGQRMPQPTLRLTRGPTASTAARQVKAMHSGINQTRFASCRSFESKTIGLYKFQRKVVVATSTVKSEATLDLSLSRRCSSACNEFDASSGHTHKKIKPEGQNAEVPGPT